MARRGQEIQVSDRYSWFRKNQGSIRNQEASVIIFVYRIGNITLLTAARQIVLLKLFGGGSSMRYFIFIVSLVFAGVCLANIKYLDPKDFSNVPVVVQKIIESQNCKIPQSFTSKTPHNVVLGSFANTKSKDWAVLCSKDGKSSIFVIWEKEKPCPAEVAVAEDKSYVQQTDEKNSEFSRYLSAASKETILKNQKNNAGPLPKQLGHQGINDAFAEKGSITYYCEKGKWLSLDGSD